MERPAQHEGLNGCEGEFYGHRDYGEDDRNFVQVSRCSGCGEKFTIRFKNGRSVDHWFYPATMTDQECVTNIIQTGAMS